MAKRKEKLVFKGKIFRVFQWRQRMYDGTYQTFERVERPASVQIIPSLNGRIAVTQESQPDTSRFLGFIGGRVDGGETPLQAAKRELLEESGMVANRWRLVKRFEFPSRKVGWDCYLFTAAGCRRVAEQSLENGERIRIRLITARALLGWRKNRARIGPDIMSYLNDLHYHPAKFRAFERSLGLAGPKSRRR